MRERFQADERGVSEVIGAILVFGVLVALLAIMQAQAIPAANEQVEFNHNQQVQGDIIDLQEAASRSGALGTSETVKIQAGTTYPSRLLFFNPSPPSGALRTGEEEDVELRNMEATDDDVSRYMDGSTIDNLETREFTYSPNYNEYQKPPTTTLEYGVLYNEHENGEIVVANPGSVVRENQIKLTFFAGELSRGAPGAVSIDTTPTSAPARTVTISPDDTNQPIEIFLPSELPAEKWRDILSDELVSNGGDVQAVNDVTNGVEIELKATTASGSEKRYDIRMAQVGIGPNAAQPGAEYMFIPGPNTIDVGFGQTRTVTFEVRDKYNNPVNGVEVQLAAEKGTIQSATPIETNSQGQVTIQYQAPGFSGTSGISDSIQASFDTSSPATTPGNSNFDPTRQETVQMNVNVIQLSANNNPPTTTINNVGTGCAGTADGGLLGTTLLGGEAADFQIEWEAAVSTGTVEEVTIEVIDLQKDQLAASTRYSPGSATASDTTLLRDQRASARANGNSCDKQYRVVVTATSSGGGRDSADREVNVPA